MSHEASNRQLKDAFLTGSLLNGASFSEQLGWFLCRPRLQNLAGRLRYQGALAAMRCAPGAQERSKLLNLVSLRPWNSVVERVDIDEPDDEAGEALRAALEQNDLETAYDEDARRASARLEQFVHAIIDCWGPRADDRLPLALQLGIDVDRLFRPAQAWRCLSAASLRSGRRRHLGPGMSSGPEVEPNGWAMAADASHPQRRRTLQELLQSLQQTRHLQDNGLARAQLELTWLAAGRVVEELPWKVDPRAPTTPFQQRGAIRLRLWREYGGASSSADSSRRRPTAATVPVWSGDSPQKKLTLSWRGERILEFQRSGQVGTTILQAFQDDNWPTEIDFALRGANKLNFGQVKNAIVNLNRRLNGRGIRFFKGSNLTSVAWEVVKDQ